MLALYYSLLSTPRHFTLGFSNELCSLTRSFRIPDDPISLSKTQLAISEGEHIRVSVNTTDAGYHGTTTFTNLNTSQTFSHSQDAAKLPRGPTFPSPGASAEW